MNLSELLLRENSIREVLSNGEIFPDPNLIYNIDHLSAFIGMELNQWQSHCDKIQAEIADMNFEFYKILFDKDNIRVYIKAIFNVSTYYVSCVLALDQLIHQIYKISKLQKLKIKKPKLEYDKDFHQKIQLIRDKSFIHLNSEKINNPMNKRSLMTWTPLIHHKTNEQPTCESYQFGWAKPFFIVDGIKTESTTNIEINGFSSFAKTAISELNMRKLRVLSFYQEIESAKIANEN